MEIREQTIIWSVSYLENGQLSDRYRIGTDTGCILSNRIGFCCIVENPILRASLQIRQLLTVRTTQDNQRTIVLFHPPCVRAPFIHDTGEGWRTGGRRL